MKLACALSPGADAFAAFLGRPSGRRRLGWPDIAILVAFAAAMLAYFLPAMGDGMVLSHVYGDVAVNWYWWRGYLGQTLREGRLAFINPYMMAGAPFLASNQTATFYPPNWLFAFLSCDAVLNWQTVAHFWLGLAAMYGLARRIGRSRPASTIAAVVFGFTGFAVPHWWQGHLVFVCAWPWTPLAVWCWVDQQTQLASTDRPRNAAWLPSLLLAAVLALQFLSGHPQINYFTFLILGGLHAAWTVFALVRRRGVCAARGTVALVASVCLFFFLVAVQALPTAELARYSIRAADNAKGFYYQDSLAPADTLTMFAPWVFGGMDKGDRFWGLSASYWEVGAFITASAFTLVLAAVSSIRRIGPLGLAAAVLLLASWLLALGRHTLIYDIAFRVVPGLSLFRCPGRMVYLVTFFSALLGAFGCDHIRSLARCGPRALAVKLGALFAVWTVGAMILFVASGYAGTIDATLLMAKQRVAQAFPPVKGITPELLASVATRIRSELWTGILLGLAAVGLLCLGLVRRVRYAGPACVAALAVFEAARFSQPYLAAFNPEWHRWPAIVRRTIGDDPAYRIATARSTADSCQGTEFALRTIWGNDPMVTDRFSRALGLSQRFGDVVPQWLYIMRVTPLVNAIGARHLIGLAGHEPDDPAWRPLVKIDDWAVMRNDGALPRWFTVGAARNVPSTDVPAATNAADFQPTATVIVEEPLPAGAAAANSQTDPPPGTVSEITRDAPESFAAIVEMTRPGWFVLMDQFLPGWEARIDGAPARIYRANAVGRALPLPPGRHTVTMDYSAPGFSPGARISAGAWTLWLVGIFSAFALRGGAAKSRARQP